MSRLICNCPLKNSSLANGTKLHELKKKRNDKLQSNQVDAKKMKHEQRVEIQVGSVTVEILCPGQRAVSADLLVLLKKDQLEAVFTFLKEDCEKEDQAKRAYKKSGKFAKGVV